MNKSRLVAWKKTTAYPTGIMQSIQTRREEKKDKGGKKTFLFLVARGYKNRKWKLLVSRQHHLMQQINPESTGFFFGCDTMLSLFRQLDPLSMGSVLEQMIPLRQS